MNEGWTAERNKCSIAFKDERMIEMDEWMYLRMKGWLKWMNECIYGW